MSKGDVKAAIQTCQECQTIDPAPVHWQKGTLSVKEVWKRLGMDITHYGGEHYLTVIDCGPTRFSVWRKLRRQDSACVVQHLEAIFWERGPPEEILTDNDTAFCSRQFKAFLKEWGVQLRLRCAYVPSGNGIVERCHRSVKRIAARKRCTIMEAVYRYNITPRDDVTEETAPSNAIYSYKVRVKDIDVACLPLEDTSHQEYKVGDGVWVKPPNARCTSSFVKGHITGVISTQSVLVDGTPRHVRDLRPIQTPPNQEGPEDDVQTSTRLPPSDSGMIIENNSAERETSLDRNSSDEETLPVVLPRRSERLRVLRRPCALCDEEIRGGCGGH